MKRSQRIIEQLRRLHPSGDWEYVRLTGSNWVNKKLGMAVVGVSIPAETIDGPSDNKFEIRYMDNWPDGQWLDGVVNHYRPSR